MLSQEYYLCHYIRHSKEVPLLYMSIDIYKRYILTYLMIHMCIHMCGVAHSYMCHGTQNDSTQKSIICVIMYVTYMSLCMSLCMDVIMYVYIIMYVTYTNAHIYAIMYVIIYVCHYVCICHYICHIYECATPHI